MEKNRKHGWRKTKHQYLLSRRVTCGTCGCKMIGEGQQRKRLYLYYRCPATYRRLEYARTCDAPGFRADHADSAVWGWVKSFLTDPAALELGLKDYQAEQDEENASLRERLSVVDDSLAENQRQLERLLDLYQSGRFSKEMLADRIARLEKTVAALQSERGDLAAHLETRTVTREQTQSLQDFAAEVAEGLQAADESFQTRRRIIETLDVRATLAIEDEQKIIYARCLLGERLLQAAHTAPHTWSADS